MFDWEIKPIGQQDAFTASYSYYYNLKVLTYASFFHEPSRKRAYPPAHFNPSPKFALREFDITKTPFKSKRPKFRPAISTKILP